jgi:crotonobetainyl-CoA:carnitine CoA-transferase CaiB-like acyl-CoA transferase
MKEFVKHDPLMVIPVAPEAGIENNQPLPDEGRGMGGVPGRVQQTAAVANFNGLSFKEIIDSLVSHLMTLPLEGILVVDLTRAVSGPFCTMNLGDLGARVVKIEEPGRGDECRQWGPPFVGPDSAYFIGINRNKESVTLDLKSSQGRKALLKLCAKADVVIENFRPGVMQRLGADYASLGREDLVYVSISGFGQTGPNSDKAGYDILVQAMSGLMAVSAYPDGPPVKCGFPVADIITAFYASQAILSSLFARGKTGKGRYIEIALLEAMLGVMCSVTSSWLLSRIDVRPMGAMQTSIVPYQIFRCGDGMMVMGAPNEKLWQSLCRTLGHPEWIDDPRFVVNEERVRNRDVLIPMIEAEVMRYPRKYWMDALERDQVPCGPVLSTGEVLSSDGLRARGAIVPMQQPGLGTIEALRNPMRFSDAELRLDPSPGLGEHTEQVLREFGLS